MSRMIVLGQPVLVNCACCGKHGWHIAVMTGRQKLTCPSCRHLTVIEFLSERDSEGDRVFKMDVWPA